MLEDALDRAAPPDYKARPRPPRLCPDCLHPRHAATCTATRQPAGTHNRLVCACPPHDYQE